MLYAVGSDSNRLMQPLFLRSRMDAIRNITDVDSIPH